LCQADLEYGCIKESMLLVSQMRFISKQRLTKKQGKVNIKKREEVFEIIQYGLSQKKPLLKKEGECTDNFLKSPAWGDFCKPLALKF